MILFASDLHLSAATPGLGQLFADFLAGPVRHAEALYLLGDVFEYWAGDDCLESPDDAVVSGSIARLREATAAGVEIGFITGNRDFLIGEGFVAATGVRVLPDPFVLSLPVWQFVLTHGDQLCTDDDAYQEFRGLVRSPEWRREFLARPLAERRRIIAGLRADSEAAKREKAKTAPDLMNVNPGATDDFLREYGYATLIHGHTHRPDRHDHIVDGIHCERWVLGDWREDARGARGEYIAWDGERLTRHRLER